MEYSADVEDTGVGLEKKLQIDVISSIVLGVNLQLLRLLLQLR